MALVTTSRLLAGTPWRSANSRASAALHGEVDVRDRAGKASVVKHRGEVEQLAVKRDPASRGDGRRPGVGTMGVVAYRGCQEVLGCRRGVSGQRGVRGRKTNRLDGGAASRMHAQGHRQQ